MDEVLLNKAAIIERCLRRVEEEYAGNPARLENFTHQDAIVLNLERACQAAIDMAMHLIAKEHMGIPQSSAQSFDLLERAGRINGFGCAFAVSCVDGTRVEDVGVAAIINAGLLLSFPSSGCSLW